MKTIIAIAAIISLAGCQQSTADKAQAMKTFANACARPVSGIMSVTAYGNDIKFHCAEFKPMTETVK